jgi:hypothetical protein
VGSAPVWTVLAVSGAEAVALVTAVVAAVAAALSTAIAAWQGVLLTRSERRRTQPVVVAAEWGEPEHDGGSLLLAVALTNEGAGPAFELRFGLAVDGEEVRYTAQPAGPLGLGDVPRVLGAGRTLPEGGGSYSLRVPPDFVRRHDGQLENRILWCRYKNSFGDPWETQNPWQADHPLRIVEI